MFLTHWIIGANAMAFMTLILMTLLMFGQAALSFVLDGSSTSYAQFRKWNAALNGSLEFEFKTEQGNGLLLYTDDGGTYDFFEVKLVESALRLRYNLGGGAQIVTVGHDLGDGHWHKVQISRSNENTTLTVDGVSAISTSRGKEFEFGKLSSNSDVYVGGMPGWYNSKLTLLALPSVIFEPRFNGFIRNLVYADPEKMTVTDCQTLTSLFHRYSCNVLRARKCTAIGYNSSGSSNTTTTTNTITTIKARELSESWLFERVNVARLLPAGYITTIKNEQLHILM
ncbi:hypothetical protein M0804_004031 [Polistes exclamans]|nr:hypothetical protein M0804_004031 [Polistes exclamans]